MTARTLHSTQVTSYGLRVWLQNQIKLNKYGQVSPPRTSLLLFYVGEAWFEPIQDSVPNIQEISPFG